MFFRAAIFIYFFFRKIFNSHPRPLFLIYIRNGCIKLNFLVAARVEIGEVFIQEILYIGNYFWSKFMWRTIFSLFKLGCFIFLISLKYSINLYISFSFWNWLTVIFKYLEHIGSTSDPSDLMILRHLGSQYGKGSWKSEMS